MKSKWSIKRLCEVAEIQMGQSPKGSSYNISGEGVPLINGPVEFGETPFSRTKRTKFTTEPTKMCRAGDLILCVRGSTTGRMNIAGYDSCIGRGVASIRSEKYQDWINFFIHVNRETIYCLGSGATFPNVSASMLAKLEIPIPPESEQKRIVAIMDEAFEGIDRAIANTEKNLANSRELFGNILNLAIQGKITSQNPNDDSVLDLMHQIREKRTVAIKEKKLRISKNKSIDGTNVKPFEIPDSWRWVPLEDLAIGITDGVHQKPEYVSEGIPFVTVKNLTAGTGISFENLNYITRQDHEEFIKRAYPERGDILISKDGTIGVVRIIDTDIEFSIFVSVALVKPALCEINRYLALALEASVVQSQIIPKGTALKHLYLIDLRQLAIPLPPLAEQKRIVEKLNILSIQTQRLETIYRQKIAALNELKQSILQKAFTGELTADTPKTVKEEIAA